MIRVAECHSAKDWRQGNERERESEEGDERERERERESHKTELGLSLLTHVTGAGPHAGDGSRILQRAEAD